MPKSSLAALALLAGSFVAEPVPAATANDTVLTIFRELSALPRGSFKEGAARAYLVRLAESRDALPGITYETDAIGNLIFRVPGTGRFKSATKSIALQAHLDMVWDVRDAPAGADLAPYFANGVVIEETNGWLHTKDKRTTLGADNGFGVAVAARYLTEREEQHPPLELVFTAAEERGLVGALELALPIRSPVLLNLDAADGKVLTIGCLGSRRRIANATVPGRAPRAGATLVRMSIGGLLGGHSGELIHEPRINAIQFGATALLLLTTVDPELGLLAARGGDRTRLNVIPKSLEATLEISAGSVDEARARVMSLFAQAMKGSRENPAEARVTWEVLGDAPAEPANRPIIGGAALVRVLNGLTQMQNGPSTKEAASPNGVGTSSNIGYLEIRAADAQRVAFSAGFMARSYKVDELAGLTDRNLGALRAAADGVTVEALSQSTPWHTPPGSPLTQLAQKALKGYETTLSSGGLEPAGFVEKYPELQILSLGATIADAHSFNEALNIESAHALVRDVSTLLVALAESPILRNP